MDEPPILRLDRQNRPDPHILPAGPRVSLHITRGRVRERVRPVVGRVFLIGAASDCDLVLGDLQFPEAYAYLFVDGADVTIRRLGNGPELFVCGQPVESGELLHGDLVEMGPFELRVVIDRPPPRGRFARDSICGVTFDLAETDRLEAIDEVQMLLADIRAALSEESAALRLFPVTSESPLAGSMAAYRRRASA
jgi:pSer/pThr/pTyr-binding forkhead associated (FHA) protein